MTDRSARGPRGTTASHRALEPVGLTSALVAVLTSVLWGGTPVAIRYSVEQLPPAATAFVRFSLAAVAMVLWCRLEGTGLRVQRGRRRPVVVAGLLLFLQMTLFHYGTAATSASHASVLISTFVIWVVLIEHFITHTSRLTTIKSAGLVCAMAGGVIAAVSAASPSESTAQDPPTLFGDTLVLASAVLLGIKIVYTQHALKRVEPGQLILWHHLTAVPLFLAWSMTFEQVTIEPLRAPVVGALLYQGVVVAGFCFAIQAHLLKRHPAWQISVFSCLTPLFGIAFGAILRGDSLSAWLFVSGALVALGLLIVTVQNRNS